MSRPATGRRTTPRGTVSTPPRTHLTRTGRGHQWATKPDPHPDEIGNPFRGLMYGLLFSIPLWALISVLWRVIR